MKIFLVLLHIASLAFPYQADNISLSDYEFRRYVRPQLKSITNEFQTLLFALNPDITHLKPVYSYFRDINSVNRTLVKRCETGSCLSVLEAVESLLLKSLKGVSNEESKDKNRLGEVPVDYIHEKNTLYGEILKTLLKVQNSIFQIRLTGSVWDVSLLSDQLNFLYAKFNSFLHIHSDERFRNELNSFWVNFVRPVERFVLGDNDKKYLEKNLSELNILCHILNVKLTKRGYDTSKQVSTLVNIMHRRWNNILKVSLKPKG